MFVLRRLLGNLVRLVAWPLLAFLRIFRRRKPVWLHVRLDGAVLDFAPPTQWWRRMLAGWATPHTTAGLRRAFERIGRRGRVSGLVVELWPLAAGWATCRALRQALEDLKHSGVEVVIFLPQGAGQRELLVAGAASRVVAAPHTQLRARGLSASRTYFGALLRRAGVDVEVTAAGRFKTAAEAFERQRMSEAERTQLRALLHSLSTDLSAESLSLPSYPHIPAERALEANAIAALAYPDELAQVLGLGKKDFPPRKLSNYLRTLPGPVFRPLKPEPFVAVVMVHGVIGHGVGGRSMRGIQLDPMVKLLRGLADNPRVQAVVLHIDSPGGSAANSDLLHREVSRVAARKPVVAWFANVAASGGYYIACAAHRIVADPMSLTGSIGVIGIKPALPGLLGWAGIRVETVKTKPHADMGSIARRYDQAEQQWVHDEVESLYARFVEVVAEGRRLPVERVRELAGGRVYSGRDAADVALVDRLGGEAAVREALAELWTERGLTAAIGELRPVGAPLRTSAPPPPAGDAESLVEMAQTLWSDLSRTAETPMYLAAELPRVH